MKLLAFLRAVWADPVGSNVIAGVVVTGANAVYVWLTTTENFPRFMAQPVALRKSKIYWR